jgi:hypothetical protein
MILLLSISRFSIHFAEDCTDLLNICHSTIPDSCASIIQCEETACTPTEKPQKNQKILALPMEKARNRARSGTNAGRRAIA